MHISIEVASGESLFTSFGTAAAISLDGTRLAFVVGTSRRKLFVRPLDQLEATEISGTGQVHSPFFSRR